MKVVVKCITLVLLVDWLDFDHREDGARARGAASCAVRHGTFDVAEGEGRWRASQRQLAELCLGLQGSNRAPEVAEAKDPLEASVELDLALGSGSVWFTAKGEESVMVSLNELLVAISEFQIKQGLQS